MSLILQKRNTKFHIANIDTTHYKYCLLRVTLATGPLLNHWQQHVLFIFMQQWCLMLLMSYTSTVW